MVRRLKTKTEKQFSTPQLKKVLLFRCKINWTKLNVTFQLGADNFIIDILKRSAEDKDKVEKVKEEGTEEQKDDKEQNDELGDKTEKN